MTGWLARLLAPRAPALQGARIKSCCLVPENRVLVSSSDVEQPNGMLLPIETRQCKVCHCNHHRMFPNAMRPGKVSIS